MLGSCEGRASCVTLQTATAQAGGATRAACDVFGQALPVLYAICACSAWNGPSLRVFFVVLPGYHGRRTVGRRVGGDVPGARRPPMSVSVSVRVTEATAPPDRRDPLCSTYMCGLALTGRHT
jgi:hypothetical protein